MSLKTNSQCERHIPNDAKPKITSGSSIGEKESRRGNCSWCSAERTWSTIKDTKTGNDP
ncbi:hypothetical protein CU097_006150 [Rhizopus azygosporus]|uniref:Uncharacterized protein n=1 Tax=Rhizopus azygosporus TaxID=86630 RepID=A0A367JT68_RHIAZ|nr:hypothetical protein CU097_006150 [Rhizopus azygosporus]